MGQYVGVLGIVPFVRSQIHPAADGLSERTLAPIRRIAWGRLGRWRGRSSNIQVYWSWTFVNIYLLS